VTDRPRRSLRFDGPRPTAGGVEQPRRSFTNDRETPLESSVARRRPTALALIGLFSVVLGADKRPFDSVARAQQKPSAASRPVDFARDIQPVFQKHCIECHGPKKARARLRLHDPAFISKGGLDGPVVVPGKSDESLLISRVMGLNGDDQMPLDAEPLPDSTVALLRAWIDQGAVMPAATTGRTSGPYGRSRRP
jgi:mono/diheme cytochrome c family protein